MAYLDASVITHGYIQEFDPSFVAWDETGPSLVLDGGTGPLVGKVEVCPFIHGEAWAAFPVERDTLQRAVMLRSFRVEVDTASYVQDDGDKLGLLVEDKGKLCIACRAPKPRPFRLLLPISDTLQGEGLRMTRAAFSKWRIVTDAQEGVVTVLEVIDGVVV